MRTNDDSNEYVYDALNNPTLERSARPLSPKERSALRIRTLIHAMYRLRFRIVQVLEVLALLVIAIFTAAAAAVVAIGLSILLFSSFTCS